MSTQPIPDDLRRFILTSIPSVPYLEAVLLLRGESMRQWTAHSVAARLYIAEAHALELLQQMQRSGVVALGADAQFLYSPQDAELRTLLDELAAAYVRNLVGVTGIIHSRIGKRAHQFADAFRWKKDGP
jgi:hypothetical protein